MKSRRSDGTIIPWASVATAQPGDPLYADLVSWADRVRDYGMPVEVTFHHEPTAPNGVNGTASDFVAAWRRFVDVFRAEGAANASRRARSR